MNRFILFILLVVLASGAIFAVNAAYEESGEDITNTNETFTNTSGGDINTLDDSDLDDAFYDETVTVYDENGTLMEAGADYTWFDGNGTLKVLTGGDIEGDDDGTVTYGYDQVTTEQTATAEVLGYSLGIVQALAIGAPIVLFMWIIGRTR